MKRILFTGDSITDGNRYKAESERWDLNHQIGHCYAYVVNALMGSEHPEQELQFINRGISGNRVIDLYGRIYEDMIELQPDIISILVGVNDGPLPDHKFHATGKKKYGQLYRMMLNEVKEELPETKLVICEPFVAEAGRRREDYKIWRECIDGYREEAASIAEEFGAIFVPLQDMFDEMCKKYTPEYWIWDGVHPTENGHGLIAKRWMECTKSLF
jgi:lysophospholipase L1-like esterase